MKINLIDFLSTGESEAITTQELSKLLGWNKREITLYINALRRSGEVICSSISGYYLPSCLADVERFYRQMTSRQNEIEKAKQSAKKYIEEHGGTIDD